MNTYLYDVCNDYSLDLASKQDTQGEKVTWRKRTILNGLEVTMGWNEYDELVYLKSSNPNLSGLVL